MALGVAALEYRSETLAVGDADGTDWRVVALADFYMTFDVVRVADRFVLVGLAEDQRTMAIAVASSLEGPWTRQPAEPILEGFYADALIPSSDGSSLVAVGYRVGEVGAITLPLE